MKNGGVKIGLGQSIFIFDHTDYSVRIQLHSGEILVALMKNDEIPVSDGMVQTLKK